MKIATNFAVGRMQQMAAVLVPSFWLLVPVMLVWAGWLIAGASSLRQDLPELRQRLERVKADVLATTVQPVQLPPAQELADTRERVMRINAVAQTKGMTTMALLTRLEAQLPSNAWLVSFHHRAAAGEAVLIAAAANEEILSGFLLKLEHDPAFEEAMLLRELAPSSNKAGVQFEIRIKVRP